MSMHPFVQASLEANRAIYALVCDGMKETLYEKSDIGAGGDRSSGIDLAAEAIFIEHLGDFGTIESEESGIVGTGEATVILDPIDGSSNLLSGLPYYGTSAALVDAEGRLEAATVCNLATGEFLYKVAGERTTMRGRLSEKEFRPVRKSSHDDIGIFEKAYANPSVVAALKEEGIKFRSPGAVAVSLAYAHEVSFVLFVGPFRIYDFAAGLALCEGLEVIVEQDYVIVAKEKETMRRIVTVLKRSLAEEG